MCNSGIQKCFGRCAVKVVDEHAGNLDLRGVVAIEEDSCGDLPGVPVLVQIGHGVELLLVLIFIVRWVNLLACKKVGSILGGYDQARSPFKTAESIHGAINLAERLSCFVCVTSWASLRWLVFACELVLTVKLARCLDLLEHRLVLSISVGPHIVDCSVDIPRSLVGHAEARSEVDVRLTLCNVTVVGVV